MEWQTLLLGVADSIRTRTNTVPLHGSPKPFVLASFLILYNTHVLQIGRAHLFAIFSIGDNYIVGKPPPPLPPLNIAPMLEGTLNMEWATL
jgi:hypothetical protein